MRESIWHLDDNGTHSNSQALASRIISGAFLNLSAVARHLNESGKNVRVGALAGKEFKLEDSMFAGAMVHRVGGDFDRVRRTLAAKNLFSWQRRTASIILCQCKPSERLAKLHVVKDIEFLPD